MNSSILQLVNNPNAISVKELQTMLSEDSTGMLMGDVRKVLRTWGITETITGTETAVLPQGSSITKGAEYTKVFVWGDRGSGKTCLIGSLLSAVNDDETITIDKSDERGLQLKKCFEATGDYALLPDEEDRSERLVGVHNIVLRKRSTMVTHRSYPISFVEVPLTTGVKGGTIAKDILDKEGEQIHLLCLDSTGDIALQGQMFTRLLAYLDENNYIRTKTAGVYIVVTKTDTMYRVPREYRDMAGQTLVTAKLRGLWQKVCNICYDKGIYGATPIIYTVGDVKLQSIVAPFVTGAKTPLDLSTAHTLWTDVILTKSQPRVSGLEKVMRWGNGSLTAVAFIAFIVLAGYALYGALKPDAMPPEAVNMPYDYKAEFINKIKHSIEGTEYKECKGVFAAMHDDLEQEHTIYTIDNVAVLSEKDYASCDSALSNAFAVVIVNTITSEMSQSTWDDKLLRELQSKGRNLLTHNLTSTQNSEIEQKTQLVDKYFDEVKPLVAKINNCRSLSDVEYVMEKCDAYYEAPFTANTAIADALTNARQTCIKSYSDYLKKEAADVEANTSNKTAYAEAMERLNSSIDEFSRYLNDNGYSQFVDDLKDIKEQLREAYDNLSTSWLDFFGF